MLSETTVEGCFCSLAPRAVAVEGWGLAALCHLAGGLTVRWWTNCRALLHLMVDHGEWNLQCMLKVDIDAGLTSKQKPC